MIFGGTTNERVQYNEQTLWLGNEIEMGSYQPFAMCSSSGCTPLRRTTGAN